MPTIRFLWVEPPNRVKDAWGDVPQSVLDDGQIEPNAASNFPGPAGTFWLLPEEQWRTIRPEDPVPVFLHESYGANLEKWVNFLSDSDMEVAIVAKVRNAVMQLVDSRLADEPGAFSASATVTSTEPTSAGMAVVGRCVVLRPADV